MRKIFSNPAITITVFSKENILTASGTSSAQTQAQQAITSTVGSGSSSITSVSFSDLDFMEN